MIKCTFLLVNLVVSSKFKSSLDTIYIKILAKHDEKADINELHLT